MAVVSNCRGPADRSCLWKRRGFAISSHTNPQSAKAEFANDTRQFIGRELPNAESTQALGAALAKFLQPGTVLRLSGDLGAGKTTLTQGLARALGVTDDVLSPTFALMSEYRTVPPLLHVDAYRLNGVSDAETLGLDEYLDNGWALIVEWAENIEGALPPDAIQVHLEHDGDQRKATISATAPESAKMLEGWNG